MKIDKSQSWHLTFYLRLIFINILKQIFSETIWQIELNFDMNTSDGRGRKMYANGFAHMTKMADMPIIYN